VIAQLIHVSVIASTRRVRGNLIVVVLKNCEIASASPRNDTGDFLGNIACAGGAPIGMKVVTVPPSPPSSPQRGEEVFFHLALSERLGRKPANLCVLKIVKNGEIASVATRPRNDASRGLSG